MLSRSYRARGKIYRDIRGCMYALDALARIHHSYVRDATHYHRLLFAPRWACTSTSGVLNDVDVDGGDDDDSCDINTRGCPKGRVPDVDPPLPRPDESDFTTITRLYRYIDLFRRVQSFLILHSISRLVSISGLFRRRKHEQTLINCSC